MKSNRVASLIFFCAGLYGTIFSFPLLTGSSSQSGAGTYPFGVSILLLISGIFWFVRVDKEEETPRVDFKTMMKDLTIPFRIVVVTLAFVLTVNKLGFLIASPIFLFILLSWVGRYKLWIAACTAVIIGIGSWLFFVKVLAIDLPKGIWNL
jgi:hypothetical protein